MPFLHFSITVYLLNKNILGKKKENAMFKNTSWAKVKRFYVHYAKSWLNSNYALIFPARSCVIPKMLADEDGMDP